MCTCVFHLAVTWQLVTQNLYLLLTLMVSQFRTQSRFLAFSPQLSQYRKKNVRVYVCVCSHIPEVHDCVRMCMCTRFLFMSLWSQAYRAPKWHGTRAPSCWRVRWSEATMRYATHSLSALWPGNTRTPFSPARPATQSWWLPWTEPSSSMLIVSPHSLNVFNSYNNFLPPLYLLTH